MVVQGSRIVQRYIDYKKLQRLMKDISGFTASQRMEPGQPVTNIDPKQVPCTSLCASAAACVSPFGTQTICLCKS